jgi:hypothetical protein
MQIPTKKEIPMGNQPLTNEYAQPGKGGTEGRIPKQEYALAKRLRETIGEDSVVAFGKRCGIVESTLRKYFNGTLPNIENLVAMADAGNVSIEWLATGRGAKQHGASPQAHHPPAQAQDRPQHAHATSTLPELRLQDMPEDNPYFNALWPVFSNLLASKKLSWLPGHITLEQAAGLVHEAAELAWLRSKGKSADQATLADAAPTLLYKAWLVHMDAQPPPPPTLASGPRHGASSAA